MSISKYFYCFSDYYISVFVCLMFSQVCRLSSLCWWNSYCAAAVFCLFNCFSSRLYIWSAVSVQSNLASGYWCNMRFHSISTRIICLHTPYTQTAKGATTGGSRGSGPPNFCLDPSNFLDTFFLGGVQSWCGRGFMTDDQFTYSYLTKFVSCNLTIRIQLYCMRRHSTRLTTSGAILFYFFEICYPGLSRRTNLINSVEDDHRLTTSP